MDPSLVLNGEAKNLNIFRVIFYSDIFYLMQCFKIKILTSAIRKIAPGPGILSLMLSMCVIKNQGMIFGSCYLTMKVKSF